MPAIKVDLQGVAANSNTEYQLHIPQNTVRAVLTTPGRFPIRFSLNPGEVTGADLRGIVLADKFDTKTIGKAPGPIYFAAKQPQALLNVSCEVLTQLPGGAFTQAFSTAFTVSSAKGGKITIVNRFGDPIFTNQGERVIRNE